MFHGFINQSGCDFVHNKINFRSVLIKQLAVLELKN